MGRALTWIHGGMLLNLKVQLVPLMLSGLSIPLHETGETLSVFGLLQGMYYAVVMGAVQDLGDKGRFWRTT